MEDNYSRAYTEVIKILNYVPQENVNNIPKIMIDTFKERMDKTYNFKIDTNKSFEEQKILEETKAILANIFREFWATPYQRERIEAKEKYDRQREEEEKREKYNPDILFEKKEIIIQTPQETENNTQMILYKESLFTKFLNKIKNIFVRKSY